MRAIIYEGTGEVAVTEVEDARIEEPTDILMRVTSSAICGSDLHMYDGRAGADPGLVLGHEPLGVVEEVGEAVRVRVAASGPSRKPNPSAQPFGRWLIAAPLPFHRSLGYSRGAAALS